MHDDEYMCACRGMLYMYVCAWMSTALHVYMCTCEYTAMCMFVFVCVCVCVCVCMYMYVCSNKYISPCVFTCACVPPGSWLLVPGVFKPSCSTPFTLFLRLVSVYRPFQLYFIPKTLSTIPPFQLPSYSLFLPNRPFSCIYKQHRKGF